MPVMVLMRLGTRPAGAVGDFVGEPLPPAVGVLVGAVLGVPGVGLVVGPVLGVVGVRPGVDGVPLLPGLAPGFGLLLGDDAGVPLLPGFPLLPGKPLLPGWPFVPEDGVAGGPKGPPASARRRVLSLLRHESVQTQQLRSRSSCCCTRMAYRWTDSMTCMTRTQTSAGALGGCLLEQTRTLRHPHCGTQRCTPDLQMPV